MSKHSRMLKKILAFGLTFAMVASAASMAPSTDASAAKKVVKSLKVSKANVTLTAGKKTKIKATVKGTANKKVKVSLTKANKKVISKVKVGKPNKKGVSQITFTAKALTKEAKTTVKVTTAGKNKKNKKITKKVTVVVKPATAENTENAQTSAQPGNQTSVAVTAVQLTAASTSIQVGASTKVTAAFAPTGATSTLTWASSDNSVAVVDKEGTVVGMKAGTAQITATTANGVVGKITIKVDAVAVTGVTLDNTDINLTVGGTTVLNETVSPSNATDRRVTWTSSDAAIARVENGRVTAIAPGNATITVETVDGGYKASAQVVVTADSTQDVDGLTASVTNSISGYENTVLVGTQAKVDIKVTKNGAPYGGDTVNVVLDPVSGYASYYELSTQDVQVREDGMATVYVRLKSEYRDGEDDDKTAVLSEDEDAAFASFNLQLTSGGANFTKTIPVSFAQIMTETLYSGSALSVENEHDPFIKSLEGTDSYDSLGYGFTKEEYKKEYVVDQQVTSDVIEDGNHEVVLDAAPLLVRSETLGAEGSDYYVKDGINHTFSEYSVYVGEENACTIEEVPGGLEYATLTFDKLQLSQYSRIIVRAYYAGTNVPMPGTDNGVAQMVITADTLISEDSLGKTVQIKKEIFNETTAEQKEIDIKIFVESEGQVNESENIGFTLQKMVGEWSNQEVLYHDYVRLPEAVTWTFGGDNEHTGEQDLPTAESYLGKFYDANCKYTYSMPAFPDTGNAIIIERDANKEITQYYLYPTTTVDNENVLAGTDSTYIFEASKEQVKELAESAYTSTIGSDARCTIDSRKAGFVQVKATVNVFDAVKYDVHSYVQWSPIPNRELVKAKEHYALSGQTVTLTAEVYDKNGNIVSDANVDWLEQEENNMTAGTISGVTISDIETTTNTDGQAKMVLISNGVADITDISVDVGSAYDVKLFVADEEVPTNRANIHWVKPGIYYCPSVDSEVDYDTSDDETTVTADQSSYKVGDQWIIGTRVVGATGYNVDILNISNIKIDMKSSTDDEKLQVDLENKENGVCTVYNETIGQSQTTAKLAGLIDENQKCVIIVEETDNDERVVRDYVSVGEGAFNVGADLIVPILWNVKGEKMTLLNFTEKYDVANALDPIVYVSVKDDFANPVVNKEVTYKVTDASGNVVDEATTQTNANGYIAIQISAPSEATTYTVSANIASSSKIETTKVNFTDNQSPYNVTSETPDEDNSTITLMFSTELNTTLVEAHPEFFKVRDEAGNKVDIASVDVDSANAKKLVITTKQAITSQATVTVKNQHTYDDGTTVYHVDANGTLFTN